MNPQKFLIPDGIEYYSGKEALLFERLKSSVLNIFKRHRYQFVVTPIIDSLNNLTNLNGSNISSGTVADARISTLTASKLSGALPAISGANLTNLPEPDEAPVVDFTVTANGSSAYRFSGGGVDDTADNPDLYLIRGQKYRFNNTTGSAHPFQFRATTGGSAYTAGVSGDQNGVQFLSLIHI